MMLRFLFGYFEPKPWCRPRS